MTSDFTSDNYHKIGESYKAQDTDEDIMPSDTASIFHNGKISKAPHDSRHYGFSTIGRIKPGYNTYGNHTSSADEVLSDAELQKYRKSINKLAPEYFKNTTELSRSYTDGETNDYANLRKKGVSGKDAFFDTFKLGPTDILSDEDKKYIYKDMPSCYDNMCRRRGILSGIKELGQ